MVAVHIPTIKPGSTTHSEGRTWIRLDCLSCHQLMSITKHEVVEHPQTGLKYIQTEYVCSRCDCWQFTRVPYTLATTLTDNIPELSQASWEEKSQASQETPSGPPPLWLRCYFCPKRMHLEHYTIEENTRIGQTYIKSQFICPHCQYWHTIKVPRKLAESIKPA